MQIRIFIISFDSEKTNSWPVGLERVIMLQLIRRMSQSFIVKAFMAVLVVSFAAWGIGDIFRGNALQKTVAEVGDVKISVQHLTQLFEKAFVEIRQTLAPELTAQQARQMGLFEKALQREISESLIDQEAARQGIRVGPRAVIDLIAKEDAFRAEDGSFNKRRFSEFLAQQRLSEAVFLAQGQQIMARQVLLEPITGGAFVPKIVVDTLYKARAQKRVLEVITVDPAKISGIQTPDDATLRVFFDSHRKMFETPEYRSVTIATLSVDSLVRDIQIPEDEVRREYEARRDEMTSPERRDVVQVVLQDAARASELAIAARETRDLSVAAKTMKETAVPLDQMEEKSLMPELSKAVFALAEGDVSDPVKTQLGWHVMQLKKIAPAGVPAFDEVKARLREEMRKEQAVEAATRAVNQLDDELAAGHSLDDIADALRLRLVKIPALNAEGLDPEGKAPSELPHRDAVLREAFAQNAGDTSPVGDDNEGTYFVVRTNEVVPAGVPSLEEAKDKVLSAWKLNEQRTRAQARAEKIAVALTEGVSAASFAREEGVSFRTSKPLSLLGDADEELPSVLKARAFTLKKGEAAREEDIDRQYVVRLASVVDVDASTADSRKNMVLRTIKKANGDELTEQYLQYLQTVFPVKINEELLAALRQRED